MHMQISVHVATSVRANEFLVITLYTCNIKGVLHVPNKLINGDFTYACFS